MQEQILEGAKKKMEMSMDSFQSAISGIRGEAAHPGLVENIVVDIEDDDKHKSQVKIRQIATVRVVNDDIHISPWDDSYIQKIQRKLSESSLGFNPRIDSSGSKRVVIVAVPRPSEEYRKKLVNELMAMLEKAKVDVRNVRRHANDEVGKISTKKDKGGKSKGDKNEQKAGMLSEDDARKLSVALDKLANDYIAKLTNIASLKQKNIMGS